MKTTQAVQSTNPAVAAVVAAGSGEDDAAILARLGEGLVIEEGEEDLSKGGLKDSSKGRLTKANLVRTSSRLRNRSSSIESHPSARASPHAPPLGSRPPAQGLGAAAQRARTMSRHRSRSVMASSAAPADNGNALDGSSSIAEQGQYDSDDSSEPDTTLPVFHRGNEETALVGVGKDVNVLDVEMFKRCWCRAKTRGALPTAAGSGGSGGPAERIKRWVLCRFRFDLDGVHYFGRRHRKHRRHSTTERRKRKRFWAWADIKGVGRRGLSVPDTVGLRNAVQVRMSSASMSRGGFMGIAQTDPTKLCVELSTTDGFEDNVWCAAEKSAYDALNSLIQRSIKQKGKGSWSIAHRASMSRKPSFREPAAADGGGKDGGKGGGGGGGSDGGGGGKDGGGESEKRGAAAQRARTMSRGGGRSGGIG